MTFAEQVIQFNEQLHLAAPLPENIRVMNPFRENPEVLEISSAFYRKYYGDANPRTLILGINPGRLGAGATGIPFTDPKRLKSHCGMECSFSLHEPSSVFVYEVVDAYGGPVAFYQDFFISSVCPLGFVQVDAQGKETNYNYYDSRALTQAVTPFVIQCIQVQLGFGINRKVAFCMGTGKNYKFFNTLNQEQGFFERVVPLEHPRYVMQYKSKTKPQYVDKYLRELRHAPA